MANNRWISTSSTDWGTAGNWSNSAVPVNGDVIVVENSNIDIAGTLDQSGLAGATATLTIPMSYTGKIGTAPTQGNIGTYLKIRLATAVIGRDYFPGARRGGSPRILLDTHTDAAEVIVENTARMSADAGLPPVRLLMNSATAVLHVRRGWAGLAVSHSLETSTVGTVHIGRIGGTIDDCQFVTGTGVTVNTKINQLSGRLYLCSACPTLDLYGGICNHNGTGGVSSAVTVRKGAVYRPTLNGATVVAITVKDGGLLDLGHGNDAFTITDLTLEAGAGFIGNDAVTITNKITASGKGGWGTSGPGGAFEGQ